jgi:acyl-CoA thioester hydrolase
VGVVGWDVRSGWWSLGGRPYGRLRTESGLEPAGQQESVADEERGVSRRYVTQVRVRWSDLDAFRHVNNAKTVTLLEEARVDWLFAEAAKHGVERLTQGIVVARLEIDYKRPIGMDLPVTVSMGLTKIGQASMTVDYIVSVAGTVAATALSVLVPVDPVTFKPRRLDDRERTFLTQYLHAPVDLLPPEPAVS